MANYVYNCNANKKNTGFTTFCEKIGLIKGYIITDSDVEITDEATAQTEAAWQDVIQSRKAYPFMAINGLENQSDDPTYEDTPFATELVTNGKMSWRFAHTFSQPSHRAYFTHRNNKGRIVLINEKGEYKGEVDETGKFKGFELSLINIENLMLSDGTASEKTYVKVVLANADSVNRNIYTVVPSDHSGLDLMGLIDVRLSVVTSAVGSLTLEASIYNTGEFQEGFVETDPTILDSAGAAVAIDTFTDNGDGTYQIDAAGLTAGDYTVRFKPITMTTKGFDTPEILSVTIS